MIAVVSGCVCFCLVCMDGYRCGCGYGFGFGFGKLLRCAVYHVFNDDEDEEGRPPTPGPVGAWLEGGEGEEVGLERGVEEGGRFDGEVGGEGLEMAMNRKESLGGEIEREAETETETETMTPVEKKMIVDKQIDTVETDALGKENLPKVKDTQPGLWCTDGV